MKILSIDVGIKNLSFCLMEIDKDNDESISILKWDNINLTETSQTQTVCSELDKNKFLDDLFGSK